ncbi:hypothetical protein MJH54_29295 [Salmonella enterica subsp. enterica serovar Montevideo]|nr:hypothetical protein [Salmonella enterica subsp. enterica serovar Montevideo]
MLIENRINIDLCPGIIDVDFTRENLFSSAMITRSPLFIRGRMVSFQ